MVVTKLIGGLGNQLFQFAAGRSIALRLGQELLLDVSDFNVNPAHQGFQLDSIFTGKFQVANKQQIANAKGFLGKDKYRNLNRFLPATLIAKTGVLREPHFDYWPEWSSVVHAKYLLGYWQSEKYFSDCSSIIRADLRFVQPLTDLNADLSQKIINCNSVSIHIRRGDYLSNPKANAMHGICDLSYYNEAIRYVEDRVINPCYFIFSDDIDWAKNNLILTGSAVFVENNIGVSSYRDMHLMSICKHHIIANSSFSWWAAWLNQSDEKIVVAPKKWFASGMNTSTLLPTRWVQL
jgi:hypothetical protein